MNTLFNLLNEQLQYPVQPKDNKDAYEIELSFAGFSKSQIKISAKELSDLLIKLP